MHAVNSANRLLISEIVSNLSDQIPDLWVLVTTIDGATLELPDNCIQQIVSEDSVQSVQDFLQFWKPDVAVWFSGNLRPNLIFQTAERSTPLFLLDTGVAIEAAHSLRRWPGLRAEILGKFDHLLAGDDTTVRALKNAGAVANAVRKTGVLEHVGDALPCSPAERDDLASLLDTRPVWLAADIHLSELEAIIAAHKQAMRRAHRFLLIIAPDDPDEGKVYADRLKAEGLSIAQRSLGEEPESETQVYLADTDGEMGLWYRLAPISFIGQTLVDRPGIGPDPFNAAALGSVVIHGPCLGDYQNLFRRLGRAKAARQVENSSELAQTLEGLLAPTLTAEMAHAAWETTTAGAVVLETVVELILGALDDKGTPA
ncbi:MAG: 3-deoxy-D-manno-octulosonic acid transferase [Marinosulfonomonas sp.]|nr:3-deoxy-D-manno-octulosonic acid transferase [Marinosulfonomonas sp.]